MDLTKCRRHEARPPFGAELLHRPQRAILCVEEHSSSSAECVDKSSLQRRYRLESQWTFRCNIRSIIYSFHRCPISKHIGDHRSHDNLPTMPGNALPTQWHFEHGERLPPAAWFRGIGHHSAWDAPSTCLPLRHRSHKMYSHTLVLSQCVLVHIIDHEIHTIHWMDDDLYVFRIIVGAVVVAQWQALVSLSDDTEYVFGSAMSLIRVDLDVDWRLVWNTACWLERRASRNIYVQLTCGQNL